MSPALHLPSPPMIPRRHAPVLFAFLTPASLPGVLSAAITAVNTGAGPGLAGRWLHAYALARAPSALPAVTAVAPRVRAPVERLTA